MAKADQKPARVYHMADANDVRALERKRRAMLTKVHLVVANAFDELRFEYRIGKVHLRRVIGPGFHTPAASRKHRGEFRHDVALGIVRLADAIARGQAGRWKLRRDGTRSRVRLDGIPDGEFAVATDWRAVIHWVETQGWTYTAFAHLAGCQTAQVSYLSWGKRLPRVPLGESVLWAARHVRAGTVVAPPQDSRAYLRPRPRYAEEEVRTPWWFPSPLARGIHDDNNDTGDPA